ncbi:hypothetical protein LO772_21125 [Yinghuangia sp. ASG 101]|uniref:hypothetical protein n=1 Tax=Yinghuangia sp. ASG 101 TaxID=2896848 RepID=UPI001E3B6F4A|nr:hypothetical protein [Yinghuangia sp. ASG 101]UGQ09438.1 hypothetical protein LO772_21125 [Yinghuangia sp. ASG 101]
MPQPRRFRLALAAALLVAVPSAALSACSAGSDAETLLIRPDTPETTLGALKVQDVLLVTGPEGGGGPLAVVASVYNGGAATDRLELISVNELPQNAAITPAPNRPQLQIPQGQTLTVGGPGNTTAVLQNPDNIVRAGDTRLVTFRFAQSGVVTLWVPVQPAVGYLQGYGPGGS